MKISEQLRTFANAKFIQLYEHKQATLDAADLLDKAEAALAHAALNMPRPDQMIDKALAAIRGESNE
jgi:hypothetical protein